MAFKNDTTGAEVVKTYASEASGKTILITGPSVNTIGGQTAIDLAAGSPKQLLLAGRNIARIQPVIDQINKSYPSVDVTFVELDLADLSSVKRAAELVKAKVDKLDILINNAGVMAVKDYTQTKDGFELQFGANHLGHFFLTNLLSLKILKAKGRVVNVSSFGYMSAGVNFDDPGFSNGATYNPWVAYAQAKTANILFSKALASRGILSYALNPGLILETNLMANVTPEMFEEGKVIAHKALGDKQMPIGALSPKSLAASSSTSLYAALSPDLTEKSGSFLTDAQVWTEPLEPHASSSQDAEKLWVLSEELTRAKFVVA